MKKKTITKLMLRKETLKALAASDLARVAGAGDEGTCEFNSRLRSGCTTGGQGAPQAQ